MLNARGRIEAQYYDIFTDLTLDILERHAFLFRLILCLLVAIFHVSKHFVQRHFAGNPVFWVAYALSRPKKYENPKRKEEQKTGFDCDFAIKINGMS